MLERCAYVRCLMIDFTKAFQFFDLVSHPILLAKLQALGLSDCAMNWIISYLKDHCQIIKCNGTLSSNEQI